MTSAFIIAMTGVSVTIATIGIMMVKRNSHHQIDNTSLILFLTELR